MQGDKVIFIDVETTGTNPERHGLTQISGCIQIDNEVREFFDYYVRPFPADLIEDAALKVTGIDRRQFLQPSDPNFLQVTGQEFLDPFDVFAAFKQMLSGYVDQYDKADKLQFVGYNSHSFDMPFMRRFWEKNNDRFFGSWFWYPCLDVMLVWAQILQPERGQLPNFKLATVARHCGIEVDDTRLHDSRYDIELTRQLWLAAREIIDRGRLPKPQQEVQGALFDF
jgi:DNA polymerase III subunit epsilon